MFVWAKMFLCIMWLLLDEEIDLFFDNERSSTDERDHDNDEANEHTVNEEEEVPFG